MKEENEIQTTLQGSGKAYLVLGAVGAIILALGWESEIAFFIGATIIGLGAVSDLFTNFKRVEISENGIGVKRGRLGFKSNYRFENISSISLREERNGNGIALLEKNINTVSDWKKYKFLELEYSGKRKLIPIINYDSEELKRFVGTVQNYFVEANGSSSQKLEKVRSKTIQYLEKDRKLWSDLQTSLYEACKSIYKAHETLYSKTQVEEFDKDKSVIYHSIKQGNVLVYFKKDHFLPEIKPADASMASDLVLTAKENLEVVNSRINSHDALLNKLDRLSIQIRSREKLQQVAEKIDNLQQRNLKSQTRPDMKMEAEVIEQFELLTENISHTQTLEKSILLKENLIAFREMEEGEEMLLKELNQKLEE